jgi:hypothetical protein
MGSEVGEGIVAMVSMFCSPDPLGVADQTVPTRDSSSTVTNLTPPRGRATIVRIGSMEMDCGRVH